MASTAAPPDSAEMLNSAPPHPVEILTDSQPGVDVEDDDTRFPEMISRHIGSDRGGKAHDKERPVIQRMKTNNNKRMSISLDAENLKLKEELRRMTVRSEDLLELWRQ